MVRMERAKTSLASAIDAGRRVRSIFHGNHEGIDGGNPSRDTTKHTVEEGEGNGEKFGRQTTNRRLRSSRGWRRAIKRCLPVPIEFYFAHATTQLDKELSALDNGIRALNEKLEQLSPRIEGLQTAPWEEEYDQRYGDEGIALEHTFTAPLADEFDRALEDLKESIEWTLNDENNTTILSDGTIESAILNDNELAELLIINNYNNDNQDVLTSKNAYQDVFISVSTPDTSTPDILELTPTNELNANAPEWIPPPDFPPKPRLTVATAPDTPPPRKLGPIPQ